MRPNNGAADKFLPLFRLCKLFNVELRHFQGIIRNDYYSILSADKHGLLNVLFFTTPQQKITCQYL
ncbi:hypothetical protein A7K99_19100 [Tatumella citrea]|uniref:Uncharacterized protein n=1 Tax=Tatumella citrea TaxID=53336 RepID=A0A1Y0LQ76_TATCI|nr:hypothetical protein A7K98_19115 [Tatumella citrea]ARU99689.1 hypothetical protein A7K99_19100 [Tatumella citrea]